MYEKEKTLPSITSTRLKEKYPNNKNRAYSWQSKPLKHSNSKQKLI